MTWTRKKLIAEYLKFFESKGHKRIPSASLVPENDPTVLFTTAGMHPLVPYLLGSKHPSGKRLVSVQKCLRTTDIDEVGDTAHNTFFEMLGNWSLGDYFKDDSIAWSHEFLTRVLKIKKEKLSITCFAGDKDAPKDEVSSKIWLSLGIPKNKIKFLGKKDNWWGPAGETGPCGPDTEIFFDGMEIWNNVFMEYNKDKRLILVDGMHCLYDENFNLNKKLIEAINGLNTHTVLAVNGSREKGYNLVKSHDSSYDTNWESFSLEERGIKKDNPEYFKELMRRFNLVPEEVMYFDHDKKNVETAKKLGILSKHYTDEKSISKFMRENLWAFIPLKQKNVDTGMGVERTLAILNGLDDVYMTDAWKPIIEKIEELSGKKYGKDKETTRAMRIIADHVKAAVFMISDGVVPSNTERGYVLRRLIRRAIKYAKINLKLDNFSVDRIADSVFSIYPDYEGLQTSKKKIRDTLLSEQTKFHETLTKGLNMLRNLLSHKKTISGTDAFLLYQSYGFPIELTEEISKEEKIKADVSGFQEALKKHQELSRTTSSGTFKSGLADHSEKTTRLHTATHLLNQALKGILGPEVKQRGSNITPERLRFDFNFSRKLTETEIKEVETLVNKKIKEALPVIREEIPLKKALAIGAEAEFGMKYPDVVSVYFIGGFSKEICTGPHVKNTKEVGKFKIIKEESSAAGIRRIKAVVE